jgi:L-fucose dehydrogenase
MDLGLDGKIIIVSGGARGIGAAICRSLSEEGAIPIILDIRNEEGAELSKELKAKGSDSFFIHTNLTDSSAIQASIKKIVEKYNRIDGLVNNAGINDGVGLESGNIESFRESIEKNLFHYYDLSQRCLPHLKISQGSIVNIASKVGVTGQGGTSGYAASKGAQLALTREWAVELLKYKIRVNAVLPAEVMTPLYREWISTFKNPEAKLAEIQKNIPLNNRMTEAGEIASMVVYLISYQASHITGQFIHVDGGYVHLDRSLNT